MAQHTIPVFTGLSQDALKASINYLNSEILSGNLHIAEVANYAYKVYSKALNLEQFALGVKIKKLNRLQFQSMVAPEAQSLWAIGDRSHGYLFRFKN